MVKNFFRTFLFSLAGLLALFFIVGMLLPGGYTVERTVAINAPAEKVYAQIIDLQAWQKWSPWAKQDPEAKYTYGQNMQNQPFMEWTGDQIGMGRLDVIRTTPNEKIETNLHFYSPYEGSSFGTWLLVSDQKTTVLTWRNQGQLEGFISKYYGLIIDSTLGKDFEKGLANIKAIVEKK
jgi:hypothetical protein